MGNTKANTKLMSSLNEILGRHAYVRENGRVASHATVTSRSECLKTSFNDLAKLGYKPEVASNLGHRHIEALVQHWHKNGIKIRTIQARLSVLRIFCGWIGKKGMAKEISSYLPNVPKEELVIRKAAVKSKSWSENGVDIVSKLAEADALDIKFGLMLRIQVAFGLRRMEVLQLKPHKSDEGDKLVIYQAKNGRPRDVHIDTPEQRAILDYVKEKTKKFSHLGWAETRRGKNATLKYNVCLYSRLMAELVISKMDAGVTGHGLRAQFAENAALILGLIPPTLGGGNNQMQSDDRDVLREKVSELLGHSRKSITSAYYGSFPRASQENNTTHAKIHIDNCVDALRKQTLSSISSERIDDCIYLMRELELIDVSVGMRETHKLWKLHSERNGVEWMNPLRENIAAMEAAAIHFLKLNESS